MRITVAGEALIDVTIDATGTTAIALGGLGLVMEPMSSTLRALLSDVAPSVTVVLDPNCAPRRFPRRCRSPGSSTPSWIAPTWSR